jgi:hypothetical protein
LSGRSAFVPVMQPAHFGDGDDAATVEGLYTAWIRRILVQREMRASAVIITDERLKMPAQAGLVEHNKVIKAFATYCADHSFDIGALPWRARRAVPRKSFPKLLRSPLGSGMCSHREMNNAATLVCQYQEDVKDLKPDCRDGEEVYGHKGLDMVLEEGPPSLRRRFSITHEILAHARLPDVDAELQKLAMNVRRAPAWILFAHVRMRSRTSRGTGGRPGLPLRIFHVQKRRNALRCQAITVSGFTITSAERQPAHTRDSQTHRSRSGACNCGRFFADR